MHAVSHSSFTHNVRGQVPKSSKFSESRICSSLLNMVAQRCMSFADCTGGRIDFEAISDLGAFVTITNKTVLIVVHENRLSMIILPSSPSIPRAILYIQSPVESPNFFWRLSKEYCLRGGRVSLELRHSINVNVYIPDIAWLLNPKLVLYFTP